MQCLHTSEARRKISLSVLNCTRQLSLVLVSSMFVLVWACSGGGGGNQAAQSAGGGIAFSLRFPPTASAGHASNSLIQAAVVDCASYGIDRVDVQVFDEYQALIVQGGPWGCAVGEGIVDGVPVGTNRSIVISLKDDTGRPVLTGSKSGITVISGQITDIGIISLVQAEETRVWNTTFGGSGYDGAYTVQQTKDGGYILAGETASYGAGSYDVWLIKTDADGNEQWNKTFGGSGEDEAWSFQQTKDGGYILAGRTSSYGAGSYDAWLIKTDANGKEQWNKTFGGSGDEAARSVQQTKDGGYILAGYTTSYGAGSYDAWLIKTDANGNKVWDITFGGSSSDSAYAVQQMSDGGYLLAGDTQSFGAGGYDAWLIKTDANGNKVWDITFGGSSSDSAYALLQTSDGGYILAGYTASFGAGGGDAWLIKTDANGNKVWDKTFAGSGVDKAYSVKQTKDGGYILAGWTRPYDTDYYDAWLIKTDTNGNKQWDKTFGGSDEDEAWSVQQTKDGGYIMTGVTTSYGAGSYDVWLIKTDAEGNAPATPTP